jgi:Domain of unknown function (DUF4412)
MKKYLSFLAVAALCCAIVRAQMNPGAGAQMGNGLEKLFGENKTFSATLESQVSNPQQGATSVTGKMYFDNGNSRFEIDMTQMKNGQMNPQAVAQMKAMGMDRMVAVAKADKKTAYLIYPNLQAYAEVHQRNASATNSDFKTQTTKLGEEKVDGHSCVKNKVVVTDAEGAQHEYTVWDASDLKNFPVKIEMTNQDTDVVMLFKNISLSKPDASLFAAPTSYKRYDSPQELMQEEVMKRMGGGPGAPPQP